MWESLKPFAGKVITAGTLGSALHTWRQTIEYRNHVDSARAASKRARMAFVCGHDAFKEDQAALDHLDAAEAVLNGVLGFVWHDRHVPALLAQLAAVLGAPLFTDDYLRRLRAHTQYHTAMGFMREHQYVEALKLLNDVIAAHRVIDSYQQSELARALWRKGTVLSWPDVQRSTDAYSDSVDADAAAGSTLVTARVHNSLGRLWYAMGDDAAAADDFARAAMLADIHSSKSNIAVCDGGVELLKQLTSLGHGTLPASGKLAAALQALLDDPVVARMALDILHIPSEPRDEAVTAHTLEHAERLKHAWRLRITARTNLMQVLTTNEPGDAAGLLRLLTEICGGKGVDGPVSRPYCALDDVWLQRRGGGARICTAIGAGLTELLQRGCVPACDIARVESLARRAFDDGEKLLRLTSASHQAMYNFHCARFSQWQGQTTKAASLARTAYINLTCQPADRVSQRDVRMEADMRVLMFEIAGGTAPDTVLDISKLMHVLTRDRAHTSSAASTRQRDGSHLFTSTAAELRLQRLLDGGVSGIQRDPRSAYPQLSSDAVLVACLQIAETLQLLEIAVISPSCK